MLFESLSERMDKMESGLEQKIANKVSKLLDKRVNTELSWIRRDIDGKLDPFKDEMRTNISDELEDINSKIREIIKLCWKSLFARYRHEHRAERKIVNSGSKPGVVIAKMRSHEDKRNVMLK